jgi:two-component system chemotaxis response regulator CheY
MELQTSATGNGRSGRVLVVDDVATVRRPIGMTLARAGYEVVEAESGEQAIKLVQDVRSPLTVDVILCDIRMIREKAIETITFFRQQYPMIPVVVLTAYQDVELAVSLMRQGAFDFLVKPVLQDDLLTVVSKAVEQRATWQDGVASQQI